MSDLVLSQQEPGGLNVSVNSLEHTCATCRPRSWSRRAPRPEDGVKVDGDSASRMPTSCRSRTSTTASSVPSALPAAASARPGRCSAARRDVEMRRWTRSMFDAVGVDQNKLRFLEAFAVFCVRGEAARSKPRSRTARRQRTPSSPGRGAGPGSCCGATGATWRWATGRLK